RDIAPVAGIIVVPNFMVVNPSVPAKTVPELIAYAKANPGKINIASGPIGAPAHVAAELFKMMTGTDMLLVSYAAWRLRWPICSAVRCRSCSSPLSHQLSISRLADCAR